MFEKTYIAIAILVVIFIVSLSIVFGENYNYNMTKKEKDQLIISELCYAKVDIGECKYIYGGIDTPYGEAIK